MFNKDKLKNLCGVQEFAVWHYDAGDDANAARHHLAYFPAGCGLNSGDALYVSGIGSTTHHEVGWNGAEKAISIRLFG